MPWLIQKNADAPAAAAAQRLTGLRLTRRSLALDELVFTHASRDGLTAAPAFAFGDRVRLYWQAPPPAPDEAAPPPVKRFEGRVRVITHSGEPRGEAVNYVVKGPWDELERRVYRQLWNFILNPALPLSEANPIVAQYITRVILGQDADGASMPLDLAVVHVAEQAAQTSGLFTVAEFACPITVPWDEVSDITCAGALRRLLRWAPDVLSWFDYAGELPVLHLARRADLATVNVPIPAHGEGGGEGGGENVQVQPRHDLQVPAVVLNYLRENVENDVPWTEHIVDKYPPSATGLEYGALVQTITLAGAEFSSQQTVLTSKVQTVQLLGEIGLLGDRNPREDTTDTLRTYLRKKLPEVDRVIREEKVDNLLHKFQVADVVVTRADGTVIHQDDELQEDAGEAMKHELLEGAITQWMVDGSGIQAEERTVSLRLGFFKPDGTGQAWRAKTFSFKILMTNATSRTYRFKVSEETSFTPAEAVPAGLAQFLHGQLSPLTHSGRFTVLETECTGAYRPGLNITLGAATPAVVQEVEEDLAPGRTSVTLGPPEHLAPQDLVDRLRTTSGRRPTFAWARRAGGQAGNPASDQDVGVFFPATAGSSETIPEDAGGATPAGYDPELKLRDIDVCISGTIQRMKVMALPPFIPPA